MMRRRLRAFSLVELSIVLVIVSSLAAVAIPALLDSLHGRLVAARERFVADVMAAQAWSLANPTEPASLTIGTQGYTLVRGDEDTVVTFGPGGFEEALNVRLAIAGVASGTLNFNHYGALAVAPDAVAPVIELSIPGSSDRLELEIAPTTGGVSERWYAGP